MREPHAKALPLIYYDQRICLEGYDVECMIDAAGINLPAPALTQNVAAVTVSREESHR